MEMAKKHSKAILRQWKKKGVFMEKQPIEYIEQISLHLSLENKLVQVMVMNVFY